MMRRLIPPSTPGRLLALSLLTVASAVIAQEPPTPPSVALGTRRALIIGGLPGDDEHRALYAGAVEKIARALVDRCGFSSPEVRVRFGTESREGDGPALKGSRGLSTRENLAADAEALRK